MHDAYNRAGGLQGDLFLCVKIICHYKTQWWTTGSETISFTLTFMGPCIVIIFSYIYIYIYPTRCNLTPFIWKLLYMFRVVPSSIIRSANKCIYSICYLSHRYCYLPLSWKSWNRFECAVGGVSHSNIVVTITRCCRYSCMRSWWWVKLPPETCRAVSRYK